MSYKPIIIKVLSVLFSYIFLTLVKCQKHPYAGLTPQQLIEKYEYPVEVHEVFTDDGYILTLHRIPYGKNQTKDRTPILIVPGIAQSAWDCILLGPNRSLSFLLADKGYDIWLGNVRGTTWSRRHISLDPDIGSEFWNFSMHEIGVYDIPAFVRYILDSTGQDSMQYLGYSQGTLAFFIMASEKSEYLPKIRLMSALAPAIYIGHSKSLLLKLIRFWKNVKVLLRFFNIHEIFRRGNLLTSVAEYICNENSIFVNLCINLIFTTFGPSYEEMDKSILSITFSHSPSGVSSNQFLHGSQLVNSGNFQKYDFGVVGNMKTYGQKVPPNYNTSKVTTPVALYYAENDWSVNIKNMEKIRETVPNVVKSYKVPSANFNHWDFFFGKNVVHLVYDAVIDEILKH